MDSPAGSKMNTQIYEEACAWFVECRAGDLGDAGQRDFDRWLRKSPEHLSSYIEIAAIWDQGLTLDPNGKFSIDTLIEHARNAGDDNVVPLTSARLVTTDAISTPQALRTESTPASTAILTEETAPRKPKFTRRQRFAMAASIAAVAILVGTLGLLEALSPVYATALGEQRSIQFEDGSTVELNSRSKIRVNYSKMERDVELIQGQALFHVAHDTARPFIVAVGATRVLAVGTQFDVYKKFNGTVVTVVEGRVAVYAARRGLLPETSGTALTLPVAPRAPAPGSASTRKHAVDPTSIASSTTVDPRDSSSLFVAAGEQVTVTADAAQMSTNPSILSATAWRERQIVFESATLSDVAEEFNRYNQRQLVIEDPTLYGFHISGVFSSTDPDSLIKFLRQRPGVTVTETGGKIRVERAVR